MPAGLKRRPWLGALLVLGLACESVAEPATAEPQAAPAVRGDHQADTVAQPLRLVLITDLEGVLEPCGCAGRPHGGLHRLAGALAALRGEPGTLVVVAAGNLLAEAQAPRNPAHRAQRLLKAEVTGAVLASLRLDAVVPGPADLQHASAALRDLVRTSSARVLASVAAPIEGLDGLQASALLQVGERQLGLVVADPKHPETAAQAASALRARGADAVVSFSHRDSADAGPVPGGDGFALQVATGSHAQSAGSGALDTPPALAGATHGESLWVIELRTDPDGALRAVPQLRKLEDAAPLDPQVAQLLERTLARLGAAAPPATLEPAPLDADAAIYVGARTCAACHTGAYLWWQQTRHGQAYQSLQRRRHELDLDCVGCHVTGFDRPGGARLGALQELQGVGCESCHGPGSRHADDPQASLDRPASTVSEAICLDCHDSSHGNAFEPVQRMLALRASGHGLGL